MAFRLPLLNLWARAWKPTYVVDDISLPTWVPLGYFRCQLRAAAFHDSNTFTLEVEKGLNVKPIGQTPFGLGYRVQVAGWESQWAVVYGVVDVGAGFDNEHRALECGRPRDTTFDSNSSFYVPRVDPTLVPPIDAVYLGTTPPTDYWEEPNQDARWNANDN